MGNNKGFTIIEIIVSLAIIAIASVGIFKMFGTATKVNVQAITTDKATLLAKSRVEEIKGDPYKFLKDNTKTPIGSIKNFFKGTYKIESRKTQSSYNAADIENARIEEVDKGDLTESYDARWGKIDSASTNIQYELKTTVIRKKTTHKILNNGVNSMYEDEYGVSGDDWNEAAGKNRVREYIDNYIYTQIKPGTPYSYTGIDSSSTKRKYLIIVTNNYLPEKDRKRPEQKYDYKMTLLIYYDYEIFKKELIDYKVWSDKSIPKPDADKTLDELLKLCWKVRSSSNRNTSINLDHRDKASNVVSIRLDFANLINEYDKTFYVEVANLSDRTVELHNYFGYYNKIENVKVKAVEGNVNVTNIKRRQAVTQSEYTITSKVVRKGNQKVVAEYETKRYISDEIESK